MSEIDGEVLLSASDLMRFTGCAHAATLDLARLRGEGPEPREDTEDAELLQKQGDAHEAAQLARLKAARREVVEIPRSELAADAEATRAALADGAEVVFRSAFLSGRWGGWSDFLERVERPSALGASGYEVTDTKLKRRPHPKYVLDPPRCRGHPCHGFRARRGVSDGEQEAPTCSGVVQAPGG